MTPENKLEGLHLLLSKTNITYKKYNLLFLSQVYIIENYTGWFSSLSLTNAVKKMGLENAMKLVLFKLKSPFSKNDRFRCEYLFVNEVNNKPVIETLGCVEALFQQEKILELVSDQRLILPGKPQVNLFRFVNFRVLTRTFSGIIKLIPQLFKYRKEIRMLSERFNISRLLIVFNCFDSIFLINVIEQSFTKINTKKIVLISDVHKMSRIISLHARSQKTATYVLQHGATVASYGYLPVISDRMIVWGELSKKWFVQRGADESKILIAGSPRMDNARYAEQTYMNPKSVNSVLVVMSEVLYETPFLELIRDAFVELKIPNLEISIKLHPTGTVDFSGLVHDVFSSSGLKYQVFRNYDLKKLLTECDLVFVTTSSVGMEAIIFNKPIFQFKIDKFSYIRMSYEDYDCSHIFKNSNEIVKTVSDASSLFSKLPNYQVFVSDYFYKLDGNASKRAKSFIEND